MKKRILSLKQLKRLAELIQSRSTRACHFQQRN